MRLPRLAFGALLLGSPLISRAQASEAASAPRFYVGLAAYSSYYQTLGDRPRGSAGFRVPVKLTAGYQLRPRLALELGVAYSGSSFGYDDQGYTSIGSGTTTLYYYRNTVSSKVRTTSVSALARYRLTRKPAHRMQFDVLGGLGWVYRTGSYSNTQADSISGSLQTYNQTQNGSTNALLLTAGIGTRYRLTPHFELTFDYTLNHQVPTERSSYYNRLTGAAALGLRYRFGQ